MEFIKLEKTKMALAESIKEFGPDYILYALNSICWDKYKNSSYDDIYYKVGKFTDHFE